MKRICGSLRRSGKLRDPALQSPENIARMPFILLCGSTWCNLNCPYCSQAHIRTDECRDEFFNNTELCSWMKVIPPTHLYLTGGEPLIQPGVDDFVIAAADCGHVVSFDTNICIPVTQLRRFLDTWRHVHIGVFNISHHMILGITLDYILERVELLREYSRALFVKYVGVPEVFPVIRQNMEVLRKKGVGAMVTALLGSWKGCTLPHDYTYEETRDLLDMVMLGTHALQIFGGIKSKGILCRGGNDFIVLNMSGDRRVIPCCHGSSRPLELKDTFFMTGDRHRIPCKLETCIGDYMFINDINGCCDEIDRFAKVCEGKSGPLGVNGAFDFVIGLVRDGRRIEDIEKFSDYFNKSSLETFTRCERPSELVRDYVETGALLWKSPDDVIAGNRDLADVLRAEAVRLGEYRFSEHAVTRQLIKKAAQERFGLPIKANFEVISRCILRCDFCVLSDLDKFRRHVRMTLDEFRKIWKHFEVCTTEVEFLGGEPLLNKDVYAMVADVVRDGVLATIITNAQLLDERAASAILDAAPARVLIAFDSVQQEHYESTRRNADFLRLRENVLRFIDMKRKRAQEQPIIELQLVVTRKNVGEMLEFWRTCVDFGADVSSLKPVLVWPETTPSGRRRMLDEYLMPGHPMSYYGVAQKNSDIMTTRKPGFCPNVRTVHIGSGSEVVPCWYMPKQPFIGGYCADEPFLDIWFSQKYRKYRERMLNGEVSRSCRRCIGEYKQGLFIQKRVDDLRSAFTGGIQIAGVPLPVDRVSADRAKAINAYIDRGDFSLARKIINKEYSSISEKNIILSELLRMESDT